MAVLNTVTECRIQRNLEDCLTQLLILQVKESTAEMK